MKDALRVVMLALCLEGWVAARLADSIWEQNCAEGYAAIHAARYDDAVNLFRKSIAILQAGSENSAGLANAWYGIGAALYAQGHFSQAASAYRKALEFQAATQPRDPGELATDLSALAAAQVMQHHYAEAAVEIEQAIEWNRKCPICGPEIQLGIMNNLGGLYSKQGQHAKAASVLAEAGGLLKDYNDTVGTITVAVLSNLAIEYGERRDYGAAIPLFAEAMARMEKGAPVPPGVALQILKKYRKCIQKASTREELRAFDARVRLLRDTLPKLPTQSASWTVDVTQFDQRRR